ncbi:Protein involved in cell division [Bacteroidales bacterium Barb4]|nr:Protein involved in cell division [Bacteroidales bacterium Barb4]
MNPDIWTTAADLNKEYVALNLNKSVIDYEKYKLYAIVTSSTQLEGSTLTELETHLLLDEGLTAKGKPLEHHLMVKDNYEAIKAAMRAGDEQRQLSSELLKELNALNMAGTGTIVNNALGIDGRTGTFRLVNAFSEALGYYLDAPKIPAAVRIFCDEYNRQMTGTDPMDALRSSFDAHANLVLIHPWQDGNKRTSRLVMNFMQRRAGLPLTKVHKEDSKEYLSALRNAKETEDLTLFRTFMVSQHIKTLQNELTTYKQHNTKGSGFSLIF